MFILCLQQTLCCSHACQNKYQLFVTLKCILFKSIPNFTRICCKEFSQMPIYLKEVLNTPKVFRFPNSQISRRLRSGDRAGQVAGAPHALHSAAYFWFGCFHAEKESYRPTIRVSFLSSLTKRFIIPEYRQIINKTDDTLNLLVCYGLKSWSAWMTFGYSALQCRCSGQSNTSPTPCKVLVLGHMPTGHFFLIRFLHTPKSVTLF